LKGLFIGEFRNHFHDIGGSLYALNETTLFINNFNYDGGGPDAFFWAGTGTIHIFVLQLIKICLIIVIHN